MLDVVADIEPDPRVQFAYTVGPDVFNSSVSHYLHNLGALVLPWHQATRERFDVAITASCGGLAEVHAPLVMMAHGAGRGKLARVRKNGGPALAERVTSGLDAQRLTYDGRVLASALLLAHDNERQVLGRQCPAALPVAVVAGDPCLDRLVASYPLRSRYRHALGVAAGQRLVVVASTWGPNGLFGNAPDLLPRLMDQLAVPGYRVGALLHPAVWAAHGTRQVRAWLRDCREAGLILLDPEEDWRTLVVAADVVIGDHGSVTTYAAAAGRRLLLLPPVGSPVTAPGSPQALVQASAGRLEPGRPLRPQVEAAGPVDHRAVAAALTSRPGQAGRLMRRTIYRLLGLAEPGRHRKLAPVPVPHNRPGRWAP